MQRIVLFLLMLLSAGSAWCAESRAPASSTRQNIQHSMPQTPPISVVNVLPANASQQTMAGGSGDGRTESSSGEWVLDFITFGLLVVTFFLARYTAKLWGSTKSAAKRQLRAYIGVDENPDEDGRDLKYSSSSKEVRALACAKNFGKTPAYEVYYFGRVEYLSHPLPTEFRFPEIEYRKRTVLHPSQPYFLDFVSKDKKYKKSEFDSRGVDARQARHRWYVYGYVSYKDIYGVKHWTKFCFWLSWHGERGIKSPPGWYTYEYGYNDTDDDFIDEDGGYFGFVDRLFS